MALTKDDIRKIEAVVNARADLQDSKLEQAVGGLRSTMATKADLRALEERLTAKIDTVKEMHIEDHGAVMGDVEKLKKSRRFGGTRPVLPELRALRSRSKKKNLSDQVDQITYGN